MTLTGVWINSGGVLLAGVLGSLCRRGIPEKVKSPLLVALGLCVLYIGVSGVSPDAGAVALVISVALGAFLGELADIDGRLNRLGLLVQQKLPLRDEKIAEAFVTSTLFVCAGAMSVVGGIESGTQGTYDTYLAKAIIDSIVVFFMAAAKGVGCCLSAVVALLYQTLLTVCASGLAQVVTDTALSRMSQIGALLIMAIGLNLMGVTRVKAGNLLPALAVPILLDVGRRLLAAL